MDAVDRAGGTALRGILSFRPAGQLILGVRPLSSSLGLCSGEGKPVKVEYTLTPEDYAAAMHERVQNAPGKPRWAQYVSMAALFLFLLSQGAMLVAQGLPWPV